MTFNVETVKPANKDPRVTTDLQRKTADQNALYIWPDKNTALNNHLSIKAAFEPTIFVHGPTKEVYLFTIFTAYYREINW